MAQPPPDRNFRLQWKRRAQVLQVGLAARFSSHLARWSAAPVGPLRRSSRTCPAEQDLGARDQRERHIPAGAGRPHFPPEALRSHGPLLSPTPTPAPRASFPGPRGLPEEGTGPGPATPCWERMGKSRRENAIAGSFLNCAETVSSSERRQLKQCHRDCVLMGIKCASLRKAGRSGHPPLPTRALLGVTTENSLGDLKGLTRAGRGPSPPRPAPKFLGNRPPPPGCILPPAGGTGSREVL